MNQRNTEDLATFELIWPIIRDTYGDTATTRVMTEELVRRIDTDKWDSRGREYGIMIICWDWMTGGTTAESTARKIVLALEN